MGYFIFVQELLNLQFLKHRVVIDLLIEEIRTEIFFQLYHLYHKPS